MQSEWNEWYPHVIDFVEMCYWLYKKLFDEFNFGLYYFTWNSNPTLLIFTKMVYFDKLVYWCDMTCLIKISISTFFKHCLYEIFIYHWKFVAGEPQVSRPNCDLQGWGGWRPAESVCRLWSATVRKLLPAHQPWIQAKTYSGDMSETNQHTHLLSFGELLSVTHQSGLVMDWYWNKRESSWSLEASHFVFWQYMLSEPNNVTHIFKGSYVKQIM